MRLLLKCLIGLAALKSSWAAVPGFRLVGSSGCSAQMMFVPPFTNTAVIIDNYHPNFGGKGYNIFTGAQSNISFLYPGTNISVFGTEYDLATNTIRLLHPVSNTFCSAGSFFPNGTLLNLAGSDAATGVGEGFNRLRTFNADGAGITDWVEQNELLQSMRWYASALTMVDGDILVVGGAFIGGLILNEANISVSSYEIIFKDGRAPPPPVVLPILVFTEAENLVPGKSYNLYPTLFLLPNSGIENHIFTIAGNQTIIWDYTKNENIRTLPDTPLHPRNTPSAATTVLLPLKFPDYEPTVLLCGGSSADIPNPVAQSDCWTINPLDSDPVWIADDDLPNGPQVMSDGIILPDGTILIINGARRGSGGGFMGDIPVFEPLIYNSSAPLGSRFTTMPGSTIPRMYHSSAVLLPSGEVIVAGNNPSVVYSEFGGVSATWPFSMQNGHVTPLRQQMFNTSFYPTEYRVEIFSPPYMAATPRPTIITAPAEITFNSLFKIEAALQGQAIHGDVQANLLAQGFHTHGQGMSQRMVQMGWQVISGTLGLEVNAPRDASVIPPGVYLIFVVDEEGIPSEGTWITLS